MWTISEDGLAVNISRTKCLWVARDIGETGKYIVYGKGDEVYELRSFDTREQAEEYILELVTKENRRN